jgi:hypothetical protein
MPIGVLEMNPAIPHAALRTAPLSGSFASYLLLRNSLAEPFFRLLRKLFHGELHQIGSPEFMRLMIPQAVDTFELFETLRYDFAFTRSWLDSGRCSFLSLDKNPTALTSRPNTLLTPNSSLVNRGASHRRYQRRMRPVRPPEASQRPSWL